VPIKTKFYQPQQNDQWFSWCKSLLELYDTEKQFVYNDINRTSHLGLRRWILGHSFDGYSLMLRNMLLDAMISSDAKAPGSEAYVPWYIYDTADSAHVIRKSSQEYKDATLSIAKSELAQEIFMKLFNVVGPLTKIILKDSFELTPIIKYRNSFRFPLKLDPQFHRMIGDINYLDVNNPIVIQIEGAPETVSEINSLLQWNHEKKRPVILIARNFPEEVSSTLATNWLRNSLNVIPFPYGTTLETINLAADMCAVTKGELISAHFGDVIASSILDRDKWGEVERAEWNEYGLSLYKDVDVSIHVNNIVEKLKSVEEEEVQNIYKDRILSLSNDAIEVWIDKSDRQVIEELDAMIKHYNGYITSGLVETDIGPIPKCFVDAATETAQSFREGILNIGGFLVGVNDEVVVT